MLQATTTNSGIGLLLQGDYADLDFLYESVHLCIDVLQKGTDMTTAQSEILLNFAYELRKTKDGNRMVLQREDTLEINQYYGCQFIWPDVFAFIITLEPFLASKYLNDAQKAILMIFRFIIEQALDGYDHLSCNRVKKALAIPLSTTTRFSFLAFQDLHIQFANLKQGKQRTRLLHALLYSRYAIGSEDSISFEKKMNLIAKEKGCDLSDLGFSDFPDIEW